MRCFILNLKNLDFEKLEIQIVNFSFALETWIFLKRSSFNAESKYRIQKLFLTLIILENSFFRHL
jgi:hypothetical protein